MAKTDLTKAKKSLLSPNTFEKECMGQKCLNARKERALGIEHVNCIRHNKTLITKKVARLLIFLFRAAFYLTQPGVEWEIKLSTVSRYFPSDSTLYCQVQLS